MRGVIVKFKTPCCPSEDGPYRTENDEIIKFLRPEKLGIRPGEKRNGHIVHTDRSEGKQELLLEGGIITMIGRRLLVILSDKGSRLYHLS